MIIKQIAKSQRQTIAIVILLAILIAPLCAPLCGSRACANSSTPKEDCHNSATANAGTQEPGLGAVRACALSELPAAALGETKSSRELQERNFVPHASLQSLLAAHASLITVNSAIPRPDNEPQYKNISIDAAVLRI